MKIITILIPGASRTGGPEALHQLADQINLSGRAISNVHYIPPKSQECIEYYKSKYKIIETKEINPDSSALVIPEIIDPLIYKSIKIPKFIWWLSAQRFYPLESYQDCYHLFQSHYARENLGLYSFTGNFLSDYIATDFYYHQVSNSKLKENIVLYNGAKSVLIASRLRLIDPKMKLVALRQLNPEQVSNLFDKAKVYIDFGNHPGKDRMPREAALHNCIVITNERASAKYFEDVSIPSYYKIKDEDPEILAKKIQEIFNNYDKHNTLFDNYRDLINKNREVFNNEINGFIDLLSNLEPPASISQIKLNTLDNIILENQKDNSNLEARANEFAYEIEKLLSFDSLKTSFINDLRKLHLKIKRIFKQ